ncbi:androgen-induced gene 1 protein [Scaptodrosophila lebanonensis]|uniref:Androgen-induced gene 1 protein n=1 Tax=Drosophila lebanonensis TaxID=7225 RepID=A0A6J2UA49_DROLE|nr:androgen-induced gene 1 protein [Scaptodrosophila lebanonensis]
MGKSKKQLREQYAATEAAKANNVQLETCNDAYTSGAFKYLRFLVHLLAAAQFSYGIYYHYFNVHWPKGLHEEDELKTRWGGKFKYLTFLDVIIQAIYHTLALLNDLFGDNTLNTASKSKLRIIRDYIFAAFAFPVAHNVCISFWVIYIWDRELIFPTALDAIFPSWLNHVVHTNVALLAIMDLFTCFRRYPSRLAGITGNVSFMLLYIIWMHIVRYFSGQWVYPLLEPLSMPMRYLMLVALLGFNLFCYLLGEVINSIVWEPEFKLLKQQKIKQS